LREKERWSADHASKPVQKSLCENATSQNNLHPSPIVGFFTSVAESLSR
jgi:hypothetical protein